MTELKKRFQKLVPEHFGGMQHDLMANCELIAQKFATDFSEWCIEWRVEFVDDTREGRLYTYGGMHQKYTMAQILEIYKKKLE